MKRDFKTSQGIWDLYLSFLNYAHYRYDGVGFLGTHWLRAGRSFTGRFRHIKPPTDIALQVALPAHQCLEKEKMTQIIAQQLFLVKILTKEGNASLFLLVSQQLNLMQVYARTHDVVLPENIVSMRMKTNFTELEVLKAALILLKQFSDLIYQGLDMGLNVESFINHVQAQIDQAIADSPSMVATYCPY